MPKKRKSKSAGSGRATRPVSIRRLVADFAAMREASGQDPDDAWILEPLAELKRDLVGSADPTVWRTEELAHLLLDIIPRKIHLDAEDRDRLVPVLADFFAFLDASGHWSPRSTPRTELVAALADLEPEIRAALVDPARRSMGGNIVALALSEGVDLSDPNAIAAFVNHFNSLSDEDRTEVTETGRLGRSGSSGRTGQEALPHAGAAFGLGPDGRPHLSVVPDLDESPVRPGWAEDDWTDALDPDAVWPAFLGEPVDLEEDPPPLTPEEAARAVSGTALVRRADLLLDWLGAGRKVTSTGALRQVDTAEVVRLLGIDAPPVHSMWQVDELALLWSALVSSGFVTLTSTTAHPAAKAVVWAGPDAPAEQRLKTGEMLFLSALIIFLTANPDGGDVPSRLPPLTFVALTKATWPAGVHLPQPSSAFDDLDAMLVHADLRTLADAGILAVDGDTFHMLPQLRGVLGAVLAHAMEERDLI